MKKFFSMFAFVAAIVFGAFTLASCGDDEDEKTPEQKFSFTYEGEITSTKPETINAANWADARAEFSSRVKNTFQDFNVYGTNLEADQQWINLLNSEVYTELTTKVNEYAKSVNDLTISITIKMMKGKEVYQQKTYKAWF